MAYKRKTKDVWRLYVDYGYGWEYELTEYTREQANVRKKEYRENCSQYPVQIVKGRERIKEE